MRLITPPLPAASRPSKTSDHAGALALDPLGHLDELGLEPQQLLLVELAGQLRRLHGRAHHRAWSRGAQAAARGLTAAARRGYGRHATSAGGRFDAGLLGPRMGRHETPDRRQRPDGGEPLWFEIDRDLIGTIDSDGYFTSLNAAWERILGWSREELMARPFIDFVHPDDVERSAREARNVEPARLRGRQLRESLSDQGRRLALAALERALGRRDVVLRRLRHHRAPPGRGPPAPAADEREPARLRPADR